MNETSAVQGGAKDSAATKAERTTDARAQAANALAAAPSGVDVAPGLAKDGTLRSRDFAPSPASVRRILVYKLDHFGDFIIALPALRSLRTLFPHAYIRFICGSWNVGNARACGLFDDVRSFDYFPERALHWDGKPVQAMDVFDAAAEGQFDLAIDMRVDDDTRPLLARVDAAARCGIGTQSRFPALTIALPEEHEQRSTAADMAVGSRVVIPDRFTSRMPIKGLLHHETRFEPTNTYVIYGPYIQLPVGKFAAWFDLHARGIVPGPRRMVLTIDVVRDGQPVVSKSFFRPTIPRMHGLIGPLAFDNDNKTNRYEFRLFIAGKPLRGSLRFDGVFVQQVDAPVLARLRPVELHVGERLGLLVDLIRQRTSDLYADMPAPAGDALPDVFSRVPGARTIIMAPKSNSTVRDWPVANYAKLAGLLLDQMDCRIFVTGSPVQGDVADAIVAANPGGRVVSLVGTTKWSDLPAILRAADIVICNNSGVAHQSASLGTRTLGIYSASHQPQEWGPRGIHSKALMAPVPCSPCGYEQVQQCPNDHACMTLITPEIVLGHARRMLDAESERVPTTV